MDKIFHIYYKGQCKYHTLSEIDFNIIWKDIIDKTDYEYIELVNEKYVFD